MLPSIMNNQNRDQYAAQTQRPQLPSVAQKMEANTTSRMTPPAGMRPVFSSMAPDNGQWGGKPRYMTPESGAVNNGIGNAIELPGAGAGTPSPANPFMYPGAQDFNDQQRMQWERQQRALGNLGWNTNAPYAPPTQPSVMPQDYSTLDQGQQQAAAQHFGVNPVFAKPDMAKPMQQWQNNLVNYQQQYYNALKPMFSQWPPPDQYITPIQPGAI